MIIKYLKGILMSLGLSALLAQGPCIVKAKGFGPFADALVVLSSKIGLLDGVVRKWKKNNHPR